MTVATFDRFDICEAHAVLEWDYNVGGMLHERPTNRRRRQATHVQLARLQFRPSPMLNGYDALTENGKEIYLDLCRRYGFLRDDVSTDHGEDNDS